MSEHQSLAHGRRAYRIRSGIPESKDDIPTTGHLVKAACEAFLSKRGLTTDANWRPFGKKRETKQ